MIKLNAKQIESINDRLVEIDCQLDALTGDLNICILPHDGGYGIYAGQCFLQQVHGDFTYATSVARTYVERVQSNRTRQAGYIEGLKREKAYYTNLLKEG